MPFFFFFRVCPRRSCGGEGDRWVVMDEESVYSVSAVCSPLALCDEH